MSGKRGRAGVGGEGLRVTGAVPFSWHTGRPRGHALACGPRLAKARPSPGSTHIVERTAGPRERWGGIPGHPRPRQALQAGSAAGHTAPGFSPDPRSSRFPETTFRHHRVGFAHCALPPPARETQPRTGWCHGQPGPEPPVVGGGGAQGAPASRRHLLRGYGHVGLPRGAVSRRAFFMMWLHLVPHPPPSFLSLPCDPDCSCD